jgi:4-oxalocrotonate tautomerase
VPLIQINLAEGRTVDEKRALLAAVTQAAVQSIGVTATSVRVWINEVPATDFMVAGELLADRRALAQAT